MQACTHTQKHTVNTHIPYKLMLKNIGLELTLENI